MSVVETLKSNRDTAMRIAEKTSTIKTRELLQGAERNLVERLRGMAGGTATFTNIRMQSTLAQIRDVLRGYILPGMQGLVVTSAEEQAKMAGQGTIDYLNAAEKQYKGIGAQALALDEASMMDAATSGARASVLRRLASSGTPAQGADAEPHKAKVGILQRYGMNVIEHFEGIFRTNLLARSSFEDTRNQIVAASPFLQGKPASWSERIVRTESMNANGRATFEATQEAHEQLGDLVKILMATFDNRTGQDSWNQHGQIRRPTEPFEYVADNGDRSFYQHPPNRPNDREIVVTHRESWPLPPALRMIADGRVQAAYTKAKKTFPGRPNPMSTVGKFGTE